MSPRYTSPISRIGHLRASDADRDQVAERLRAAATEGRIGFDELEERLSKTLAARTYGELEAVVADLPRTQPPARRSTWLPASPVARAAILAAVAVPLIAAAIVAVTALLSAWLIWAVVIWCIFGCRRQYGPPRRHGPRRAHWHAGPGPGRGPWT